jgi:hypothetical protein
MPAKFRPKPVTHLGLAMLVMLSLAAADVALD